jgi:hypothetical protein
LFNTVINHITTIVSENIDFNSDIESSYDFPEHVNQVFLSYAHVDKLYTLGLFHIFKDNGIFLYIDWMNNGEITEVDKLKSTLNKAMEDSKQFLFLRTLNSELGILGSGQIRQWCSWEIGNYYCKNKQEKFYTNIYEITSSITTSKLLETFKPLKYLAKGKMN